jgi:hypothetical protein
VKTKRGECQIKTSGGHGFRSATCAVVRNYIVGFSVACNFQTGSNKTKLLTECGSVTEKSFITYRNNTAFSNKSMRYNFMFLKQFYFVRFETYTPRKPRQ